MRKLDEECDDIKLKLIAEKTNSEVCNVNLTGESLFDDSSSTFLSSTPCLKNVSQANRNSE